MNDTTAPRRIGPPPALVTTKETSAGTLLIHDGRVVARVHDSYTDVWTVRSRRRTPAGLWVREQNWFRVVYALLFAALAVLTVLASPGYLVAGQMMAAGAAVMAACAAVALFYTSWDQPRFVRTPAGVTCHLHAGSPLASVWSVRDSLRDRVVLAAARDGIPARAETLIGAMTKLWDLAADCGGEFAATTQAALLSLVDDLPSTPDGVDDTQQMLAELTTNTETVLTERARIDDAIAAQKREAVEADQAAEDVRVTAGEKARAAATLQHALDVASLEADLATQVATEHTPEA